MTPASPGDQANRVAAPRRQLARRVVLDRLLVFPAEESQDGFWVDLDIGGFFLSARKFQRRGTEVACVLAVNDDWGNDYPEPVVLTRAGDIVRWLNVIGAVLPDHRSEIEAVLFAFAGAALNAYERTPSPSGSLSLGEFVAAKSDASDLIENAIPMGGLVLVVGSPESFKSFVALQCVLAVAGGLDNLFGIVPNKLLPGFYVSGEKSPAKVRDRLARMQASSRPPTRPVRIVHRRGVRMGTPAWDPLVEEVRMHASEFGGCLVVLDTLASVAPPEFNENAGQDMAVVIDGANRMIDVGATVVMTHHPARARAGDKGMAGGERGRGHSSLWGAADAVIAADRRSRRTGAVILRCEIKDGDQSEIHLRWNRETFLLERRGDEQIGGQADSLSARFRALVLESADGLSDEALAAELYSAEWLEADVTERKKLRTRVRAIGSDLAAKNLVTRRGAEDPGNAADRWVGVDAEVRPPTP